MTKIRSKDDSRIWDDVKGTKPGTAQSRVNAKLTKAKNPGLYPTARVPGKAKPKTAPTYKTKNGSR
jgi:hypothetical protein